MRVGVGVGVTLAVVGRMVVVRLAVAGREEAGVRAGCGYERGFLVLADEAWSLSVRFFVVAIVFLLLDLETAALISTPLRLRGIVIGTGVVVMGVVWVYILGTVYEWYAGRLQWFRLELRLR